MRLSFSPSTFSSVCTTQLFHLSHSRTIAVHRTRWELFHQKDSYCPSSVSSSCPSLLRLESRGSPTEEENKQGRHQSAPLVSKPALSEYGDIHPLSLHSNTSPRRQSFNIPSLPLPQAAHQCCSSPGPLQNSTRNDSIRDTEAVYVSARQNSRPSTLRPSSQATAFSQSAETL